MENSRFLECLASDYTRLRTVAAVDLAAEVPTCPGWSVADLSRHVGEVYLHKTQAMRTGAEPEQWPPPGLADEPPIALLDRAYAELTGEFAKHRPEEACGTWFTPDQTVGFWIRRMAQETIIHRIDGELGTRQPVAPIAEDLALDGIDELLRVFVEFSVTHWSKYFVDVLGSSPGYTYAFKADGTRAWRVRTGPGLFQVEDGSAEATPDVTVSGAPADLLRWVWNRESSGESTGVTVDGNPTPVAELKRVIATATQ